MSTLGQVFPLPLSDIDEELPQTREEPLLHHPPSILNLLYHCNFSNSTILSTSACPTVGLYHPLSLFSSSRRSRQFSDHQDGLFVTEVTDIS